MTKYLYFEGKSGISGDMTVASLLDLGASRQKLENTLNSLITDAKLDFDYHITEKNSYSINGTDFDVNCHDHTEHKEEEYHENHNHDHSHEEKHHHHTHRHLNEIYTIIDKVKISQNAKELSKKIFHIIAESEAKVHGTSIEKVHFHEVGAVDSIVDIISVAVLIDDLNINRIINITLTEGQGTIMCQHGEIPIPVPTVVAMAEKFSITINQTNTQGEMITPTGIAIISAIKTDDKLPNTYKILKTGIGLGKRDFGKANFLRTMIIEDDIEDKKNTNEVYILETNIDDSTPEELGYVMDKLFINGALDVCYLPCFMKKNRPSYILKVIAKESEVNNLQEIILKETSTIGIRKYKTERIIMDRETINVSTKYGKVRVKKSYINNIVKYKPEYEDVKKISNDTNIEFSKIFSEVKKIAEDNKL